MTFIPTYEGIEVTKQNQLESVNNKDSYASNYYYESLNVDVSNGNIISLIWNSPMDVIEIRNPDANLLGFEEIKNKFRNQMQIQYTLANLVQTEEASENETMMIQIDKVELGLVRIKIPDNEQDFYLVPAWTFRGRTGIDDGGGIIFYEEEPETFLTINALDGSIINTGLGY